MASVESDKPSSSGRRLKGPSSSKLQPKGQPDQDGSLNPDTGGHSSSSCTTLSEPDEEHHQPTQHKLSLEDQMTAMARSLENLIRMAQDNSSMLNRMDRHISSTSEAQLLKKRILERENQLLMLQDELRAKEQEAAAAHQHAQEIQDMSRAEIASLSDKLRACMQESSTLRGQVQASESLKRRLHRAESKAREAESARDTARDELQVMRAQLAALQEGHAGSEQLQSRDARGAREAAEQARAQEQEVQELRRLYEAEQGLHQQAAEKLQQAEARLTEVTSQQSALEVQLRDALHQVQELTCAREAAAAAAQAELVATVSQLTTVKSELSAAQADASSQLAALRAELQQVQGQLQATSAELDCSRSQAASVTQAEEAVAAVRVELTAAQSRAQEQAAAAAQAEQELSTVRGELLAARQQVEDSIAQLQRKEQELQLARDELQSARDELQSARDELVAARNEAEAARNEAEAARSAAEVQAAAAGASQVAEVMVRLQEREQQVEVLKGELEAANSSAESAQGENQQLLLGLQQTQQRLNELKQQHADLEREFTSHKEQSKTSQDELSHMSQEVEAQQVELDRLREQWMSASTELTHLQQQLEVAVSGRAAAEAEVARLQELQKQAAANHSSQAALAKRPSITKRSSVGSAAPSLPAADDDELSLPASVTPTHQAAAVTVSADLLPESAQPGNGDSNGHKDEGAVKQLRQQLREAEAKVEVLTQELSTVQLRLTDLTGAAQAAATQEAASVSDLPAPERAEATAAIHAFNHLVNDIQHRYTEPGADKPSLSRTRMLQGMMESVLLKVSHSRELPPGAVRPSLKAAANELHLPVPVGYGQDPPARHTRTHRPPPPPGALHLTNPLFHASDHNHHHHHQQHPASAAARGASYQQHPSNGHHDALADGFHVLHPDGGSLDWSGDLPARLSRGGGQQGGAEELAGPLSDLQLPSTVQGADPWSYLDTLPGAGREVPPGGVGYSDSRRFAATSARYDLPADDLLGGLDESAWELPEFEPPPDLS